MNLIVGLTFVSVLAVVLGSYWALVVMPEGRDQTALKRRLKSDDPQKVSRVRLLKDPEVLSGIAAVNSVLANIKGLSHFKEWLDSADVPLTVATFMLLTVACFLAAVVAVNYYYNRYWWLGPAAGLLTAGIPYWVCKFARSRRINKFEEQFPEAVELIARAMRAGHAFATGLKMASEELPAPSGTEFKLLYERQNYGAQLPDALKTFAERIPSLDARFFVTAVLTQREAGGNLSEVLDRLATVMRERFKIKREVRVRSAHGRITAYVLAGMPPSIAVLTMMNNPGEFKVLINDPLGVKMIIGGIVLQILGVLVVRKLVAIRY